MKKIFLGLVLFSMLFTPMLAVNATTTPDASDDLRTLPEDADLIGILRLIANWLFTILMALAAISIVAAAFVFISSGGDSEKLNTARNWVIYALIGVLVALLAQVLVNFIDNMVD